MLRGFNMELNQTSAQRIDDVYSKLAQITASDTQEISTAMSKTASLASQAGMDVEQTATLLAKMIETTRESPENLGTALKTISKMVVYKPGELLGYLYKDNQQPSFFFLENEGSTYKTLENLR